MLRAVILLFVFLMIGIPSIAADENSVRTEPSGTFHDAPNLNFLLGRWTVQSGDIKIEDNWVETKKGLPECVHQEWKKNVLEKQHRIQTYQVKWAIAPRLFDESPKAVTTTLGKAGLLRTMQDQANPVTFDFSPTFAVSYKKLESDKLQMVLLDNSNSQRTYVLTKQQTSVSEQH